ncbi:MAG: type II toxin-antitoxin system VapC family toxin, partial [Actinomycetota bacterium]
MISVFVDANVLLGAFDDRDRMHEQARRLLASLVEDEQFTTDHVLVESWHLVNRRAGYEAAERLLRDLRGAPISLEVVSLPDLERARSIGELWADQRFDF